MFLLWKNILLIPIWFLVEIGQPFKFDNESSLRNLSEHTVKRKYNEAKREHYFGRIFMAAAFIIGCMFFLFLTVISGGLILLVFPIVTVAVLAVDGLMMLARFVYFREEEKKAESRNEVVVLDSWKDTSLNSILKQRLEAVKKFEEEFKARTGREPRSYEYD